MKARNFPSYRLRHRIRVWRYKRKHPWQFTEAQQAQQVRGEVIQLPVSDEVDRASRGSRREDDRHGSG
jgi:hypothetical protein